MTNNQLHAQNNKLKSDSKIYEIEFYHIFEILRFYNKKTIKDIFDYLSDLTENVDDILLQDFSRGLKNTG